MAQMTSYLEDKALIRREPDPESRRQLLLFLTEDGRAVVETLRAPVAKIEDLLVAPLSTAQVEELRGMLRAGRQSLGGSSAH